MVSHLNFFCYYSRSRERLAFKQIWALRFLKFQQKKFQSRTHYSVEGICWIGFGHSMEDDWDNMNVLNTVSENLFDFITQMESGKRRNKAGIDKRKGDFSWKLRVCLLWRCNSCLSVWPVRKPCRQNIKWYVTEEIGPWCHISPLLLPHISQYSSFDCLFLWSHSDLYLSRLYE